MIRGYEDSVLSFLLFLHLNLLFLVIKPDDESVKEPLLSKNTVALLRDVVRKTNSSRIIIATDSDDNPVHIRLRAAALLNAAELFAMAGAYIESQGLSYLGIEDTKIGPGIYQDRVLE